MDSLRKACGVEMVPSLNRSSALVNLALCIDPSRAVRQAVAINVVPLLVAVAEESAVTHTALLQAFEVVAGLRGHPSRRFEGIVQSCAPAAPGASPEVVAAQLKTCGGALALINAMISSPSQLEIRRTLRQEFVKGVRDTQMYYLLLYYIPVYCMPMYYIPVYYIPVYCMPVYYLPVYYLPLYYIPVYCMPVYYIPVYCIPVCCMPVCCIPVYCIPLYCMQGLAEHLYI